MSALNIHLGVTLCTRCIYFQTRCLIPRDLKLEDGVYRPCHHRGPFYSPVAARRDSVGRPTSILHITFSSQYNTALRHRGAKMYSSTLSSTSALNVVGG
jgi:hypothetical protein